MNPLQTTKFDTTDGLMVSIEQYDLYSIYYATDQEAKTFKVTIRKFLKQLSVQPHFDYDNAARDGFHILTEAERKKGHYGTIKMSKLTNNIDEAELLAIESIRKVAKTSSPLIISLNNIQNTIYQIKAKPNSDRIPFLLEEMQIQLDYLKHKYI